VNFLLSLTGELSLPAFDLWVNRSLIG